MAPSGRFAVVEERLAYRLPFDGAALLRFLARRAIPGVEEVDGETYRRSLRLPSGPGTVELSLDDGYVLARIEAAAAPDRKRAITIARALFDLDADPQAIASVLRRDALLAPLLEAAPGRRQPGSADAAELAARAVLGQQVSLEAAVTLAARLVADYGEPLDRPVGTVTHLFPSAAALASADPERLAMPGARRRALLGLCHGASRGRPRARARHGPRGGAGAPAGAAGDRPVDGRVRGDARARRRRRAAGHGPRAAPGARAPG